MKKKFHWIVFFLISLMFSLNGFSAGKDNPVVRAFAKAGQSVVSIKTFREVQQRGLPGFGLFGDDFFKDFLWGPTNVRVQESVGSGVIINSKGYILTNEHVIAGVNKILVYTADGSEHQAELVGSDARFDLAVLKIQADVSLPYLEMGNSDELMIGETVIAIGNPFGLGHTLTTGVVSALKRKVRIENRVYGDFIQTDAAINPGNSGGALLNIKGELVGIPTAIYEKAKGIGFAIPINRAKRIVDDLIKFGEVQPGWLGLEVVELTDELRRVFGYKGSGVFISDVDKSGPSAKANIVAGGVIVSFDGEKISSLEDYYEKLDELTVNDEVALEIAQNGKVYKVVVKACEFPPSRAIELVRNLLGIEVENVQGGAVMITRVLQDKPASRAGLMSGD